MKNARRRNRWIMGTFVGAAAIAAAIDHTRNRLPEPVAAQSEKQTKDQAATVVIVDDESATPCGLEASPCSLDESPCSLDEPGYATD